MSEQSKTAAYRDIVAKRRLVEETSEVEMPSGMVWTLRRPNLEQFVAGGVLPLSLVEKMAQAMKDGAADAAAIADVDPKETVKIIGFIQKLLLTICVNPRISLNPQSDDEISPAEILNEDYNYLVAWGMGGGAVSQGLETFSRRPATASVDKPHSEQVQGKSERPAKARRRSAKAGV